MDANQLIEQLTSAAAAHNWIATAVIATLLIVPLVLKMLGKSVPVLDGILSWAAGFLPQLRKATDPKPVDAPVDPSKPSGLAAVVPIADKKEDK